MAIKIRIPSPLRSYTQGADVVESSGSNVGEVLNNLKSKAAGIETRLFKGTQLNRFVNVYLNDEDIRFLKNLETPVKEGDEISIIPAIAGGMAKAEFSRRCWFTFPTKKQVEQPIIWQMSRKFPDVVFDIRQASVQNELGIMAVLLSGKEEEVKAAMDFIRSKGVTVEPIEKSVIEG